MADRESIERGRYNRGQAEQQQVHSSFASSISSSSSSAVAIDPTVPPPPPAVARPGAPDSPLVELKSSASFRKKGASLDDSFDSNQQRPPYGKSFSQSQIVSPSSLTHVTTDMNRSMSLNAAPPREVPSASAQFQVKRKASSFQQASRTLVKKTMPMSRWIQLYSTSDWWSLWIGLISFSIATAITFLFPYNETTNPRFIVPQPRSWDRNPFDAWSLYAILGTIVLLILLAMQFVLALYFMNKFTWRVEEEAQGKKKPLQQFLIGFLVVSIVAILAFWLGRQEWCSRNGLGYAIWSIVFGMILSNLLLPKSWCMYLEPTYKYGEFFIKCSLVLLAVEWSVLGRVGLPALCVAWLGSPIVLIGSYLVGTRLLAMQPDLALLISTGATWCGASAISAVGSILESPSQYISLSISIVAAFTVIFTFVQPYIAMAAGIPDPIAGAWIGASVDQTGNVIASAAILSEEATEVAGIVKIVLNSGLGVLATLVAFWWSAKKNKETNDAKDGLKNANKDEEANNNNQQQQDPMPPMGIPMPMEMEEEMEMREDMSDTDDDDEDDMDMENMSCLSRLSWVLYLWDKFPKFVLGYFLCSTILSLVLPRIDGQVEGLAYQRAILSLNNWWFALAFVGIGLGTNIKELWEGARKSGIIQLYLIANMLDIFVALGLSYAVF